MCPASLLSAPNAYVIIITVAPETDYQVIESFVLGGR